MIKHNVLLEDGTVGAVGTIGEDAIDHQEPNEFIGETVTVHLTDENGNPIEVSGVMSEVL